MPTPYTSPLFPNSTATLNFDLVFPAWSPLLRFSAGWHSEDGPISPLEVNGSAGYRSGVGGWLYAPVLGAGICFQGAASADYDGWLNYTGPGFVQPLYPQPDGVLYDDRQTWPGFTRRAVFLETGTGWAGGAGQVDIANLTVLTGMNSSA
jgi:hypothetical protein